MGGSGRPPNPPAPGGPPRRRGAPRPRESFAPPRNKGGARRSRGAPRQRDSFTPSENMGGSGRPPTPPALGAPRRSRGAPRQRDSFTPSENMGGLDGPPKPPVSSSRPGKAVTLLDNASGSRALSDCSRGGPRTGPHTPSDGDGESGAQEQADRGQHVGGGRAGARPPAPARAEQHRADAARARPAPVHPGETCA